MHLTRRLTPCRYDATTAGGQRELEIHRDGSLLTFNILLSDPGTFSGGGTMLEPLDAVVRPSQGACIVHSGHWRHAGHPITAGKRYILVGFIDARDARIRPFPVRSGWDLVGAGRRPDPTHTLCFVTAQSVLELHRSLRGAAGSFTDRWVLDHVFDRAAPPRWLCSTPSPSSVPLEVKGEHARPGGVFSRQSHSGRQTTHPALSEVLPQIEALVADQREAAQQKWHHSRGVASSFRGGAAAQRMGSRYQPRPARPGERRPGPLPPMTGPSKSRGSRNTTAAADSTDSAAAAARASARAQAWARASASWAAMRLDPFSKGVRSERNTVQHARRGPGNSASPARAWNAPRREPKRRSLADIIHPHRGSLTSVVRAGGSGRYSAACAR